jgi:3-oxoacyl-[acyl-carrier protein] reductase
MLNLELTNKVVLITGANGGIGSAIAKAFLEEGAIVLAGYRGNIQKLNTLKIEVPEFLHANIIPLQIDLNNLDLCKIEIDHVLTQVKSIDILINCAGTAVEKPFLLSDFEEFDSQIQSNFLAPIKLTQMVLKTMLLKKKGCIINISSIVGSRFGRGIVVYSSAKAAIDRFTKSLAMEVGRKGIRVNAVCPGMIETKMTNMLQKNIPPDLLKMSPLSRPGKPFEIARAVLFLASENMSSYITGTTLIIDGGLSI